MRIPWPDAPSKPLQIPSWICDHLVPRFVVDEGLAKGDVPMADNPQEQDKRRPIQKMLSLREDGYYANCTMLEATPFDVSILFGKVRPKNDESGQPSLVEVYEKQIYLSHLQARALYDALGRSLSSMAAQQSRDKAGQTQ